MELLPCMLPKAGASVPHAEGKSRPAPMAASGLARVGCTIYGKREMFTSMLQKHHHFWLLETQSTADCALPWQHVLMRERYLCSARGLGRCQQALGQAKQLIQGDNGDIILNSKKGNSSCSGSMRSWKTATQRLHWGLTLGSATYLTPPSKARPAAAWSSPGPPEPFLPLPPQRRGSCKSVHATRDKGWLSWDIDRNIPRQNTSGSPKLGGRGCSSHSCLSPVQCQLSHV